MNGILYEWNQKLILFINTICSKILWLVRPSGRDSQRAISGAVRRGEAARWKARLLQTHRSQQERNLQQRGYGLDERILRTNREIQQELQQRILEGWKDECPYAEAFQVELFL